MENYKTLIKLLYKRRNLPELLKTSLGMEEAFPSHIYPLEWFCKVNDVIS